MMLKLVVLALLVACSVAAPYNKVPKGWEKVTVSSRSVAQQSMNISVAIKQRNIDQLEPKLYAVSDPASPDYGHHLSFQQVVDLVAPTQDTIDTVVAFFTAAGVDHDSIYLHQSRDALNVLITVAQAQSLFGTTYSPFRHLKTGAIAMLMDSQYILPANIAKHIDIISAFNQLTSAPSGSIQSVRVQPQQQQQAIAEDDLTHKKKKVEMDSLSWSALNNSFSLRAIVNCKDGSLVTLSGNYATCTQQLQCGATTITSFDVKVKNYETDKTLLTIPFNSSCFQCYLCANDGQGRCPGYAYHHNISLNTVECRFRPATSYIVPNYVNYYLAITPIYSDGSKGKKWESYPAMSEIGGDPFTVKDHYFIPRKLIGTQPSNTQSAAAFLGQSVDNTSLPTFLAYYGIKDYSDLLTIVNPQYNSGESDSEAELDIQTLMSIAQNVKTALWCEDPDAWIWEWITDVLAHPDAALVNTISYGDVGPSPFYNPDYIARCDIELLKAGLRGLTITVSSGDNGVYGYNYGSEPYAFQPEYPAQSPYITSVGATLFFAQGHGSHKKIIEVACSNAYGSVIASGGGFSLFARRPYYQDKIIAKYIKSLPHNQKPFNYTNRAYPDVAMLGHNVPTFYAGALTPLDGTSASSPFFAGFVTLLNDLRLAHGKSPLGFLNPLIYSMPERAFTDITIGNGYCNAMECAEYGFPVQEGWDASTGRGSPIFTEWAAYVLALP